MQEHRCSRCGRVLATVPAPAGSSAALLDPLVERRVVEAVARHAAFCAAEPPPPHE